MFLALAAAVSCSGDGAVDSASRASADPIADFAAAVKAGASQRPALAVPATTIVADAAGVLAPSGSGATSVDDRGVAHEHIPIWVPQGRAGIQPDLSLEYASGGANSLVGVGWQLAGLSRITRCKGLRQYGKVAQPILWNDGDSFCLDGEPLVDFGDDHVSYGKFHDDGSRILRVRSSSSDPGYWQQFTRDGRILTFGRGTNAQVSVSRDLGAPVTMSYALSRVEDRAGNFMTVTYESLGGGDILPQRIDYTGTASDVTTRRSITFNYVARPDVDQGVVGEQYFTYPDLLASIEMHAPNSSNLDPLRSVALVYKKSAATGRSLLSAIAECDGAPPKSLPVKSSTPLCRQESFTYAPAGGLDFAIYNQDTNGRPINDVAEYPISGVQPNVQFLDVDGDGRDDVLYLSSDADEAYHLRLSTGYGLGSATTTDIFASVPADLVPASSIASAPIVLDFDGDGHADVLVNQGSATAPVVWVFLANNASGTWTLGGPGYEHPLWPTTPYSYVQSGDFNGDGRPDFAMLGGSDTYYYSLNTDGTIAGLTTPAPLPTQGNDYNESITNYFLDFNGDGVTDMMTRWWTDKTCVGHKIGESNGEYDCFCDKMGYAALDVTADLYAGFGSVGATEQTGVGGVPVCTGALDAISHYTPLFGDFNGDGNIDVVTMNEPYESDGSTVPYDMQLSLGGGDQSFTSQGSAGLFNLPDTSFAFQAMDVDLDGTADLVARGYSPYDTPYTMWSWKNQQWVSTILPIAENPNTVGEVLSLFASGDANGDGLADFVAYQGTPDGSDVGVLTLYQRETVGAHPDALTNATGDFGPTTTIEYQPYLAGSGDDRSDCRPPLSCPGRTGYVASEVDVDNGSGGIHAQKHAFAGARADMEGWGFLGFKTHTITDVPTQAVTTRSFDFSEIGPGATPFYPFLGLPYEIDTGVVWFASGQAVTRTSQTAITYDVIGTGPFMAEPSVIEAQTNDSNVTTPIAEQTTLYQYDAYGNRIYEDDYYPLESESRITNTSYLDDTTDWIMGRPTYVSTTSTTTKVNQSQTRETAYTYDALGQLAVQIDNPGASDNGSYDPLPTQLDGVQTLYTRTKRDPNGMPTLVEQLDNLTAPIQYRATKYTYDTSEGMYVVQTTDPALLVTNTAYEPGLGVLAAKSDPAGLQTTYQYDTFGRIRAEHPPGGADRIVAYHAPAGTNHGSVDDHRLGQLGHTDTLDSLRRTVSTTTTGRADGKAVSTETTYDPLGRVQTVSRPHFAGVTPAVTTTSYDNLGRVITIAGADGSTTSTSYLGAQVTSTNADGNMSMVTSDSLGRPVTSVQAVTTGPAGLSGHVTTTTLAYGAFDTVSTTTDTLGDGTRFNYDRDGRMLWKQDLDTNVTAYTYDVFGQVTDLLRGASLVTLFQGGHARQVITGGTDTQIGHDGDGRVTTKTAPDVSQTFTYDSVMLGKLSSAAVSGGTTVAYTYDGSGNVKTKQWNGPRGKIGYTYAYDKYNRLSTMTYPPLPSGKASLIVQNTYSGGDVGGQLTEVDDVTASPKTPYWKLVSSDASDAFPVADLANSVVATYAEDPMHPGWLKTVSAKSGSKTIQDLVYTREGGGRVHERQDLTSNNITETFGYDGLERLTSWSWTGPVGQRGVQYVYDDIGNLHQRNITAGPGTSVTYNYGGDDFGPHQVASDSNSIAYAYDGQGNQLVAPSRSFAWNSFDRPLTVTAAAGTYALVYDGDLARFSRTDPEGDSRYSYGGSFEEFSDSAGTHDVMTLAAGTRPVGEIEKVVKGTTLKSTTTNTLLVDALGSIDTIVTSSGAKPIKYDPFGTRVQATDPTLPITAPPQDLRAGFTGHDHDDDVNLIDMIGRVYDPVQQHFLSIDPMAPASKIDGQAYNPYAYVRNNPLDATDPTGYLEVDLMGIPWKWNDNITYGSAAWFRGNGWGYATWGGGYGSVAIVQGTSGTLGPGVSVPGIPGTYSLGDFSLQVRPMDWAGLATDVAPGAKASDDDLLNYFVSIAWMSAVAGHDVAPVPKSIDALTLASWTKTLTNGEMCGSCWSAGMLNADFAKWTALGSEILLAHFHYDLADGHGVGHIATLVMTDQGDMWLNWGHAGATPQLVDDLYHQPYENAKITFEGFETPEQSLDSMKHNYYQQFAPATCTQLGETSNPFLYSPTVVFIRSAMNGL
ncbi:MAG TPA: FG-GAP-like repeat-containing protein [Kofleriaceae bacterium]|jgi:RHS repeat-associated protein